MPGVVEEYVSKQRERSFNEGLSATRSRMEERYFNATETNRWDAYLGNSQAWSNNEERQFVSELSHKEIRFIAKAQFETPGSRYATDDAYRHGAREAVMEFSREHNHRLKEAEQQRESQTRPRESVRIQFG